MENNESKKVCIKNCKCYYFDDIIKSEDFDFDNILIDEKLYKFFFIFGISCKNLIDSKPLRIRLNKLDGFIRIYDGTRYLTSLGSEIYASIYNRFRYL